ncbi:BQ2448_6346 [Microbotryum intermedium]|uniref:BQ2448_6346 protein n=1 Tax=Microbotryum intermedium TaxID=269621 RepID=A0A238FS40_9BASI|nr:BQ2448_6346 [Microbotryum intermedium]
MRTCTSTSYLSLIVASGFSVVLGQSSNQARTTSAAVAPAVAAGCWSPTFIQNRRAPCPGRWGFDEPPEGNP